MVLACRVISVIDITYAFVSLSVQPEADDNTEATLADFLSKKPQQTSHQ